jgi:hypothetical protein
MATLAEENPLLMAQILPQTTGWEGQSHSPYVLKPLSRESAEFKQVESQFERTNRGLTIVQVNRVENPFLWGQYLLKKEKMKAANSNVKEISFFHGTRKSNVDGICRYNFDWRRCGQSRGHKFGRGVSFAPEVSYARHYTFNENVMILAKVLVGRTIFGNSLTVVPPSGYDTTINSKGTVYVKYEDNEFYPQYVIHYRNRTIYDLSDLRFNLTVADLSD